MVKNQLIGLGIMGLGLGTIGLGIHTLKDGFSDEDQRFEKELEESNGKHPVGLALKSAAFDCGHALVGGTIMASGAVVTKRGFDICKETGLF